MKPLVWAFVQDTTGISDVYTVNGFSVPHPELHTIVGVHETNKDLGHTCNSKLFHSKTDIIYPLELDKMVACYSSTPSISLRIVNHGVNIVNHTQGIVNG